MGRKRRSKFKMPSLTEAQRALAAEHVALAMWLASRTARRIPRRRPAIVSAAGLGLCTAARDYREPSPIKFDTFARFRIRATIGDAISEEDRQPIPFSVIEWRRRTLLRRRIGVEARRDGMAAAEELLEMLPPGHAAVLRLVAVEGRSEREAARSLGIAQATVRRKIAQSRTLLQGA